MTDDQTPPADLPAEPAPTPSASPEMTVETAEAPAQAESTHLPANESISETPPESISEPSKVPESAAPESVAKPVESPSPTTPAPSRGAREMLARANTVRHAHMQKNLDAIIAELQKSGTISNNGVQKQLHTSNASAIRYLSMLVKQGKIVKRGKGRGVVYVRA